MLPSEQAQPLPTTLQQGAALEPLAVADADADADASDTLEEASALIGRAPLALSIEVSIPLIKIRPKLPKKCQKRITLASSITAEDAAWIGMTYLGNLYSHHRSKDCLLGVYP